MRNFYAVRVGRKPGVYDSWDEARIQVDHFPRHDHRRFTSRADAEHYVLTGELHKIQQTRITRFFKLQQQFKEKSVETPKDAPYTS